MCNLTSRIVRGRVEASIGGGLFGGGPIRLEQSRPAGNHRISPGCFLSEPLARIMQTDLLPRHMLTVRIGCAFAYEATQPVPLLLNLKPRRDPLQALHEEKLVLGSNLPAE